MHISHNPTWRQKTELPTPYTSCRQRSKSTQQHMWFPTNRNWSCPDNLCKLANSRILTTCISQSSTTLQTNSTDKRFISDTLPCAQFQGWPGQGQGDHFQGCIPTTDTNNFQKEPSSSQLQGWPGTHSCSYKITHLFFCQAYSFQGNTDPRWTSRSADNIQNIVAYLHYSVTLTSIGGKLMTHAAHSVLDNDTGKKLNYGQLRKHPKFQETQNFFLKWNG